MGRIFIEHLGGDKVFLCKTCGIPLSSDKEIVSTRFNGSSGPAYLFNRVVNVVFSSVQDRIMITGRHLVCDVMCIKCNTRLGWIYEHAAENSEVYKEGLVILEKSLFVEHDGITDPLEED
ncbi:unnamed protein product [Dicrocoelium dendriticum]|nr:unnamed protein product [Dicrocoelium dendriticum]